MELFRLEKSLEIMKPNCFPVGELLNVFAGDKDSGTDDTEPCGGKGSRGTAQMGCRGGSGRTS